MPNRADEVARCEVGVLVSTIVSLIAPIALNFGISTHSLYFSATSFDPSIRHSIHSPFSFLCFTLHLLPDLITNPCALSPSRFSTPKWMKIELETAFNAASTSVVVAPWLIQRKTSGLSSRVRPRLSSCMCSHSNRIKVNKSYGLSIQGCRRVCKFPHNGRDKTYRGIEPRNRISKTVTNTTLRQLFGLGEHQSTRRIYDCAFLFVGTGCFNIYREPTVITQEFHLRETSIVKHAFSKTQRHFRRRWFSYNSFVSQGIIFEALFRRKMRRVKVSVGFKVY